MGDAESSGLLWFIVGLVFMLPELALPGFVVIFFGIGAWVAALCAALGIVDSFNGQVAVFLISSILTLVLFRKQGKKYFKGRLGELREARAQQAVPQVRRAAHSLKSNSANVGAMRLASLCKELEKLESEQAVERIQELLSQIESECQLVQAELNQHLQAVSC